MELQVGLQVTRRLINPPTLFNARKLTLNWSIGEVAHSVNNNLRRKLTAITCNLPASAVEPARSTACARYSPAARTCKADRSHVLLWWRNVKTASGSCLSCTPSLIAALRSAMPSLTMLCTHMLSTFQHRNTRCMQNVGRQQSSTADVWQDSLLVLRHPD
jgi:hypothetical protein